MQRHVPEWSKAGPKGWTAMSVFMSSRTFHTICINTIYSYGKICKETVQIETKRHHLIQKVTKGRFCFSIHLCSMRPVKRKKLLREPLNYSWLSLKFDIYIKDCCFLLCKSSTRADWTDYIFLVVWFVSFVCLGFFCSRITAFYPCPYSHQGVILLRFWDNETKQLSSPFQISSVKLETFSINCAHLLAFQAFFDH